MTANPPGQGTDPEFPFTADLAFPAPILNAPVGTASVLWEGEVGEPLTVFGFKDGFAEIGLDDDDDGRGYVREDAIAIPETERPSEDASRGHQEERSAGRRPKYRSTEEGTFIADAVIDMAK